jgi:hypothetical protein
MPSASVTTTIAVKPGCRRADLAAIRKSEKTLVNISLVGTSCRDNPLLPAFRQPRAEARRQQSASRLELQDLLAVHTGGAVIHKASSMTYFRRSLAAGIVAWLAPVTRLGRLRHKETTCTGTERNRTKHIEVPS